MASLAVLGWLMRTRAILIPRTQQLAGWPCWDYCGLHAELSDAVLHCTAVLVRTYGALVLHY